MKPKGSRQTGNRIVVGLASDLSAALPSFRELVFHFLHEKCHTGVPFKEFKGDGVKNKFTSAQTFLKPVLGLVEHTFFEDSSVCVASKTFTAK